MSEAQNKWESQCRSKSSSQGDEITKMLKISPDTIGRRFENEPGVIDLGAPERRHKRRYRVLRIEALRKILTVLGIVVVLIAAAIGMVVATFDPNAYRGTIQTKLEQQLSRKVSLGDMNLGLFPLRFRSIPV